MPLTKLDEQAALIVIDLQKGIIGAPTVHSASDIVQRAAKLARAFRERNLPVVLVNVAGRARGRTDAAFPNASLPSDWTELATELEPQPSDYRVTKQRPGAFIGTNLDETLRQHGVTQIVLAGISTSLGVESTARSAYDLGYHVVFVVDAMTDRDLETHHVTVEKVFPRIGEKTTTDELLKLLHG